MKSMRPLADTDRRYDNLAYIENEQSHHDAQKVGLKEMSRSTTQATKSHVRAAKTQIRLSIRRVFAEETWDP